MKRALMTTILLILSLGIAVCGAAEETQEEQSCTLCVYMPMGNESGNESFRKLYPQVAIQSVEHLTKEDIFTLVLTQSSDVDLFGSNTYNQPSYRELVSREFYAPIESAKLRSFAENCYPGVREVLFVEDQLVGIPVWCLQAYQFGVEKSMWRELGLDDDRLPKTWIELFDFIQNQWPALSADHPEWCAIHAEDYWILFYELLDDYSVYRRQLSSDPGYDTEVFRETMSAYLSIRPEEQMADDDEKKALFSAELQISPAVPDLYSEAHYDYAAIGYTEDASPEAFITLGLMIINPYSENRALCEAYLECLVDHMDPVDRAILQSNDATPVLTEGWEEFSAEYKATLENYSAQIASAHDAAAKQALQLELDAYVKQCADLLSNQWLISRESLEKYRQTVKDQVVMWDDAMNEREVQLFQELCNRVYDRAIPVDAIITQLNRLYYFKALEDS